MFETILKPIGQHKTAPFENDAILLANFLNSTTESNLEVPGPSATDDLKNVQTQESLGPESIDEKPVPIRKISGRM